MSARPSTGVGSFPVHPVRGSLRRAALLLPLALIASSLLTTPALAVPAAPPDVAGTVAPPPGAPAGNLLDNGGFESPAIAGGFQEILPGGLTDWTIDQGKPDIVRAPHWEALEGQQVLDIDGTNSPGTASFISQQILTTPRGRFLLCEVRGVGKSTWRGW